jgi:hypothetical protein
MEIVLDRKISELTSFVQEKAQHKKNEDELRNLHEAKVKRLTY